MVLPVPGGPWMNEKPPLSLVSIGVEEEEEDSDEVVDVDIRSEIASTACS